MKRVLMVCLIFIFALVVIWTSMGCAAFAQTKVFKWKHQCAYPESDKEYQALKPFVEAVKERSNGRLIIQTFPGGSIVPAEEQLSACAKGVIDVCHATGGYWRGVVPVADVEMGLPFMYVGFRTLDSLNDLLYNYEGGLQKIYREAYAKQAGVYYLGSHSVHSWPIIMSTRPLRSIEDFKGLKIRITGAYADLLRKIGASPMFLPGGELYMALKRGTVDAVTWSIDGYLSLKFYEVAKYINVPGLSDHVCSHFLINPGSWEALPDDLKQIYKKAYHEVYIPELFDLYEKEFNKVYEKEKELGYKIVPFPKETLKQMKEISMQEIWPKIAAKDKYCKEAIEMVKKYSTTK